MNYYSEEQSWKSALMKLGKVKHNSNKNGGLISNKIIIEANKMKSINKEQSIKYLWVTFMIHCQSQAVDRN